jgi:hypothetical protein
VRELLDLYRLRLGNPTTALAISRLYKHDPQTGSTLFSTRNIPRTVSTSQLRHLSYPPAPQHFISNRVVSVMQEAHNHSMKQPEYTEGPQESFERGMKALFKVPKADIVQARNGRSSEKLSRARRAGASACGAGAAVGFICALPFCRCEVPIGAR